MILSNDVGSLPYTDKLDKLPERAQHFAAGLNNNSAKHFEQTIVNVFLDKLKAGISVPAFPQFRDMNEMFLSTIEGLEKVKEGYIEASCLAIKPTQHKLPEVVAIERNAEKIHTQTNSPFKLRVCVTGPYTLASFFPYRTSQTYRQLGRVLSEIVKNNIFAVTQGEVTLISIDEPLYGLVDDPLIDRGTEGRESLLQAWKSIADKAKSRNVETCIHLHCTSDDLFWEVKPLKIIESHIDDPLYTMKATKQRLEREDKLLNASIAISDFDLLIKEKLGSTASNDDIADAWKKISRGTMKPEKMLESVDVMKNRLMKIIERFGVERVAFAGPECGLRGFPTYASAIECLKRVSKAVE